MHEVGSNYVYLSTVELLRVHLPSSTTGLSSKCTTSVCTTVVERGSSIVHMSGYACTTYLCTYVQ